ncbi:S4 domain-containing protein YaaA [Bacillus sp. FJAT-47783]|uniref:S4 domain-containing protein YaaA n=1 Tax=Bacillus sp. FJAT-47783 TaxID=2922712 RepID=UPI001FAC6CE5|nr:S4 domain-containing protein YaaA [Bacillus sp. FJAT-47783]
MEKVIKIETEHITLGQFLKLADVIQTGGMAKWFLQEYEVYVNDEIESRRGRKLRDGDVVYIPDVAKLIVKQ